MRNNDFTMRFQKGDKEINALLDSLTEIIKQSKSGAELRERYYKAIIDRVNAGIIAIDSNGNVRICNDNALKMLGMKYAANTAAINRSLPGFDNIIADSTVAGTTIVGCGKDKNLSVSVSGFVHDGNTTVCVLTDIHNALSHKEVDAWINLTRVLTHEIMNSIAPINALSDSLLPTASGTMKEKIEVIRDTSASLMAFTETFRKFSAIPKPAIVGDVDNHRVVAARARTDVDFCSSGVNRIVKKVYKRADHQRAVGIDNQVIFRMYFHRRAERIGHRTCRGSACAVAPRRRHLSHSAHRRSIHQDVPNVAPVISICWGKSSVFRVVIEVRLFIVVCQ